MSAVPHFDSVATDQTEYCSIVSATASATSVAKKERERERESSASRAERYIIVWTTINKLSNQNNASVESHETQHTHLGQPANSH